MGSPAGTMRFFRVRNLEKYQHYRDRNPPWIKLHQSVTEDTAFALLPDAAKSHLMLIWLLASRTDNKLPFDPVFIGARINARDSVDLNLLVERGFLVLEPLARRKPAASAALAKVERPNRDIEQRTERENNEPPNPPAHAGGPTGNGNGNGHHDPAELTKGEIDATVRRLSAYWRSLASIDPRAPGGVLPRPVSFPGESNTRGWSKGLRKGRISEDDIRESIASRVYDDLVKVGVPVWDVEPWPPPEKTEERSE